MYSTESEIFHQVQQWLQDGDWVVLFTVIKTWGSAPRNVGALFAVNRQGELIGSVSGGCVENDLVERTLANEFQKPAHLHYGVTKEQTERFGLPCGGVLELIAEPLHHLRSVQPIVNALQQRRLIGRSLDLETGAVSWSAVNADAKLSYQSPVLHNVYGPSWQLLIIGAGQTSRYLAEFALALDYNVIICDPRVEYASSWQVEGTMVYTQMPDDVVREQVIDERNVVVALTHDPKLDDMALMEALLSPAFYVGALGSSRNNAKRMKRLLELDVPEIQLMRLHAPVGLPIGSHTPPEIALSVLAEITALRHGKVCRVGQQQVLPTRTSRESEFAYA